MSDLISGTGSRPTAQYPEDGHIPPEIETKHARLSSILAELGRVVVAYSGGVDSSLLLRVALDELGRDRVLAVIAVSASMPEREREAALALVEQLQASYRLIDTAELADPRYLCNPSDRCFYCKLGLFSSLTEIARDEGYKCVIDGTNADDAGDFRPGQTAGARLGVRSPLREAELGKAEIRSLSRWLGLPTWDKPAAACLASRIPYGTPITAGLLRQIDAAEQVLVELGFRQARVRHHGAVARIEVPPQDILRLARPEIRDIVAQRLTTLGYRYVAVDLVGYRTGSLNEILDPQTEPCTRALSEAGAKGGVMPDE